MLSTMHLLSEIASNSRGKAESYPVLQQHQSGINTLDRIFGTFTSKKKKKRWPVALFHNMINDSSHNVLCYNSNC